MPMRFGFFARPLLRRDRHSARSSAKRARELRVDALDRRQLLSTVGLISATTLDSRGVTVTYDVAPAAAGAPLAFGVDRSSSPVAGPDQIPVGPVLAAPPLDNAGLPTTAPGVHTVTLPLAGGLPINPRHPYVLVEANPGPATPADPTSVASFRVDSIAVVTHGGIQDPAWKKDGPPWQRQMAQSLREQGFDKVIAYNWVAASNTPGTAAKQGPKLAGMVLQAASTFPAGDPVDVQYIGHSEGAVVNTQAIVAVEKQATPELKAGYLDDTLLDPHAANPDFPGRQYSVGSPLAWYAKLTIDNFQARARDPLVFIPPQVNAAQVFYQQTPADRDHGTNDGIYNLWGQVPVNGPASYFNLTGAGVVHSGKQGVPAWFEHHVVSTLGDGAPGVATDTLTGALANPTAPGGTAIVGTQATYSGTAAPGSTVLLFASKPNTNQLHPIGQTVVGSEGTWTATTMPLAAGRYRVIAEDHLAGWNPKEQTLVPTEPLGSLTVGSDLASPPA